jgi:hypothetical protein
MSKVLWLCVVSFLAAGLFLSAQNSQSPAATAAVRGKIIFQGTLPLEIRRNMASDPFCASLPPNSEGSEDVMVYVKPLDQTSFPPPSASVVLDRRECRFIPHTVTLKVGQMLVIRNSDGTVHNSHAWPTLNKPFNTAIFPGSETVAVFEKEEAHFPIRDDIHNWEAANVGVFAHPYHMVSKLNGEYELKIPAGTYEVVAWHERLGTQTQGFEAKTGETRVLDLVFTK